MWTIFANNYWLQLGLIVGLPALLIAAMRQRWLWHAMTIWLILPLVILCAALIRESIARPQQVDGGATSIDVLQMIGTPMMLIWVFFSVIGFGVGFAVRALLRGRPPVNPVPTGPQMALPGSDGEPQRTAEPTGYPSSQAIPGGGLRVDYQPMEWSGNGHWIQNPRVTAGTTGAVLFDLWNSPADAAARFPAADVVQLDIENWYDRRRYLVTIDLGGSRYRIDGRNQGSTLHTEGPLRDLPKAYENATFPTPKLDGNAPMPQPSQGPTPPVVWRSGLIILLGALAAIGAVAMIARSNIGQGVIVTPIATVPKPLPPATD